MIDDLLFRCSQTRRGRRRKLRAINWRERIIHATTPFVVVDRANDQGATIGT